MILNKYGMIANYHTHTRRCNHATGEDREYVEAAIAAGFKTLGFSDHSPYFYSEHPDYVAGYKMRPEEAAGYFDSVRALREEYKNDIDIHLGVEMEYYPKDFDKTYDFVLSLGCEYFILGQHFLTDEVIERRRPSSFGTDDVERMETYIRVCTEAMQTGKFIYMAHPDVLHFVGDADYYADAARRLCEAAKACGMPIELNLLGIREGRYYPNPAFWRVAGEVGGDVIIGVDAHTPDSFLDSAQYKKANEYVEKFGLNVIRTLNI
ncbi:MAG: PHP domain-containing protein [Ruminococcaceae bacterium]|nr:PHP domain-containing protein [Oscillospiraceae bacterium]